MRTVEAGGARPVIEGTWETHAVIAKVGIAIVGAWAWLPTLFTALLICIAADYVSGVLAGYVEKNLDSTISRRGAARKAMIVLLVATVHALSGYTELTAAIQAATGWHVQPASAVTLFYICSELISILENAIRIGVPMPDAVVMALRKVKKPRQEDNQ